MAVRKRANTVVLPEPHRAYTLIQERHLWSVGVAHADDGAASGFLLSQCPVATNTQRCRDAVGLEKDSDHAGSLLRQGCVVRGVAVFLDKTDGESPGSGPLGLLRQ